MSERLMMRVAAALIAIALAACGSDKSTSAPLDGSSASAAGKSGPDTNVTPPNTPPTSNGPVTTISLFPSQLTLGKGYYSGFTATAFDAKGVRVAGKRAAWSSSNVSVVTVVSDTGVVFGKSLGTAMVTATIDGITATASVIVVDAPPPPTPPAPTPGVAAFNLGIKVAGFVGDSTQNHTDPVAGATVKLTRIGGVNGDTLATPMSAGSTTTDATGLASFKNLPGGSYSVDITPPASSPYAAIKSGFGAPHSSDVQLVFNLRRKP